MIRLVLLFKLLPTGEPGGEREEGEGGGRGRGRGKGGGRGRGRGRGEREGGREEIAQQSKL